tara:strand:- start:638 stop:1048 length:411 start_codon:yes stop_codon:yes gene_type:complete
MPVIEINVRDYHTEYLESRRELRNYQSRVNRYVNRTPEVKKMKESIKKLKDESTESYKSLERAWRRAEREAWGCDSVLRTRTTCAKKRRQLNNAISNYNTLVAERFGDPPLHAPPLSLQSFITRHAEQLLNSFGET